MRKKILLATSSVTPNAGIPSFNRELCSLLGEDYEMHLLVDENIQSYTGYSKVFSTARFSIFKYEDASTLLREIKKEHYDVIINSNSHIMSLLASFVEDETRLITVSHSLGTMDCDNAAFNYKYVDDIIALSSSCKDYIKKRFNIKEESKIKVIFNSVADNADAESKRNTKKKTEKIKIVFAGGSAPSKSPDLIVPIIHELCNTDIPFEFYWLGITSPPLKIIQPYNDIRQILPKDSRVIVTGLIPQKSAAEIIASCNIFLAPSRREGFPMALLEAMRIGCIPVVSDFKIANLEIIQNGKNGYVISHKDIHAFVRILADIAINHSNYKDIYDESYKTFVDELSFSVWKIKIQKLIAEQSLSHMPRKPLNPRAFKLVVWRFKMLDKFNLIENHFKEVLPCAIRFLMFYKKSNYANSRR